MRQLERTDSILAVLNQAKNRLHALKNQWPSGMRSSDDETDRKIKYLKEFIQDLEQRIKPSQIETE